MSDGTGTSRRNRVGKLLGSVVADTRPLRIRSFRTLWISGAVTTIGSQFTIVAVPKQIFDLTGSSGYVGLTGVAALLPLLFFGLWGGAIADTVDRRKLMLVTNLGLAFSAALLWAQAWLGVHSVGTVLALLALNQSFFAINLPTRGAVIARLVPAEQLPSAVALNSTMMLFGSILGPLAAGALLPTFGLSALYLADSAALLLACLAVWRLPALPPLNGPSRRAGMRDVVAGFRYLGAQKILLASFLADIIAMVAGMPRALYPAMAANTFGDPPGGGAALGWLYAAMPIGAFLCGLVSGWLTRIGRHGVAVTIAVCAWGVAVLGFGLSDSLWLAVVFLALGGAADFISMVFRSSILQTAATDEMRGRLQGVFTVVVAGGPRLADVIHGWTAVGIGTAATAAGGGALVIVLMIVAAALLPAFWRYRAPTENRTGAGTADADDDETGSGTEADTGQAAHAD